MMLRMQTRLLQRVMMQRWAFETTVQLSTFWDTPFAKAQTMSDMSNTKVVAGHGADFLL